MSQLSAEIVNINGQAFVAGLLWHAFGDEKELNKTIMAVGKTNYAASYAVRRVGTTFANAGYIRDETLAELGGAKAVITKPSLASAVAKDLAVKNVIAAFNIPNSERWALIQVVKGSIYPDKGDVVGDENEIKSLFLENAVNFPSGNIYAPAQWNISNSKAPDAKFFQQIVRKANTKNGELKPLERKAPWLLIAGLTVLVVAGGVSWQVYESAKQSTLLAERKAAIEALAEKLAKSKPVEAATPLTPPWAELPTPEGFVAACMTIFANGIYERTPGWQISEFECSPTGVRVQLARTSPGTAASLMAALPAAAVSLDGQNAALNISFSEKLASANETPVATAELMRGFVSGWQRLGFSMGLQEVPAPTSSDPKTPPPPPPPYKTYKWTATSKVRPTLLMDVINFPTVRLNKLKLRPSESGPQFIIEGVIYAI